jgi:hypothetical protein
MLALVLGAGASTAYTESPSGITMPLARDFFRALAELPQTENPWVLVGALFLYVEEHKGLDPLAFLESGIDLEELHSEIYDKAISLLGPELTPEAIMMMKAHHELIFLFAYVVNVIQNGPVSKAHIKLASVLSPTDGIVTFNWDTLMDRALAESTKWCVDSGYGVTPHLVFRDTWVTASTGDQAAPVLLKLHGSSNWITGHEQFEDGQIILIQEANPDALNIFEYGTQAYPCYAGRFMGGHEPFSYGYYPPNLKDRGRRLPEGHTLFRGRPKFPWMPEGTSDDSGLVSMPMIIPPVKKKMYDRFGSLFDNLWGQATDVLAAADRLLVIGYSFPRTDDRSVALFTEAFLRRRRPPEVIIIDPRPQRALDVFRLQLGIPDTNITVVAEPFSTNMDLQAALA